MKMKRKRIDKRSRLRMIYEPDGAYFPPRVVEQGRSPDLRFFELRLAFPESSPVALSILPWFSALTVTG